MISEYCQNAIGDCSVYREGEICFAGNLNKSTFLEKISLDRYKMRLYGPCNENLTLPIDTTITYRILTIL